MFIVSLLPLQKGKEDIYMYKYRSNVKCYTKKQITENCYGNHELARFVRGKVLGVLQCCGLW